MDARAESDALVRASSNQSIQESFDMTDVTSTDNLSDLQS